jgi:polysaccharide export outer membrane protein
MFKALAFLALLLCLGTCAGTGVAAQTAARYADDPKNTRTIERPVSPEASKEAKRLYKEGVKYGLAGLFPQAVQVLQRSVDLDPTNPDAHFALGHAYFDLKQYRNAIESLKTVLALNPKDSEARDRLGLARAMLWEQDSAKISAERRSAKISPERRRTTTEPVAQKVAQQASPPTSEPTPEQVSVTAKVPPPTEKTDEPPDDENAAAEKEETALTKIYRVGPGDVLDIRINDDSSQSTLFTITPAGFLEHPILPEALPAGGLTIEEISSRFESELKRRALVANPKVLVGVRDYASHTILVSGLVKESGTKILRREAIPLYVVVADAQPLPEAARVTVLRNQSGETFDVELGQTSEMNRLVRPGDVITLLPNVTQYLYIGGEVKQPGEKIYRRGLTLTQALIAAGGVTTKAKEARLGRDEGNGFLVVTRYKLKEIESGKVQDPPVKPGDRITIRE